MKEKILDMIQAGNLLSDMRLPSEDKLAEILGVSRTTVRSALQSLEDEGIIVKKHGLGNFVQPVRHEMSTKMSFDKAAHIPMGEPVYGEFSASQKAADTKVAQRLNIQAGSDIVVLHKVMMFKGVRSSIITEHFPASLIDHIPQQNEIPNSIYEFTEKYCNLTISKVITEILPIGANKSPFGRDNGPCLLLEEQFLSDVKKVIAFSYLYVNSNVIRPQFTRG